MSVTFSYSMGFSAEEKTELLALVASSPKWVERINGAFGHVINVKKPLTLYPLRTFGVPADYAGWLSPGIPAYAQPLPDPLHVGKRVRYPWSTDKREYTGTITSHYIDGDDCSGSYGEHKYGIKSDVSSPHKGESCSVPVRNCELIEPDPILPSYD